MENCDIVRGCVVVACCAVNLFLPTRVGAADPNATDLVRAVRKGEMWMHECESLHIRVKSQWISTPERIARRRAEIKEEFGIEDPDVKQFSDLRSTYEQSLEFAVDCNRVRYLYDDPGYMRQVKVWDGNELRIHEKYYNHAQEQYILERTIPPRMFHELFACYYGWPRSQPHSFWYDPRDVNATLEAYGQEKDFELVGCEVYRQIPCYVLENRAKNLTRRWFVGQADGLLCGIRMHQSGRLWGEHWFSDYREVVPGGWFPRATGWSLYSTDKIGRNTLESTCDQEVIEFHLNEPLADDLFALPIEPDEDGVKVADSRSGELRMYMVYKPWPSLLGKGMPGLAGIDLPSPPAAGRPLLIAFVDLEQRPSRSVLKELAASERSSLRERAEVIPIQVTPVTAEQLIEWRKTLSLPWPIGVVTSDMETVRWTWGVKSLPRLILADRDHVVRAEGFGVEELDSLIAGEKK